MTTYTISEDQNTLTSSDGAVFDAKSSDVCTGCYFFRMGCPSLPAKENSIYELDSGCTRSERDSGNSIIWIKKGQVDNNQKETKVPQSFDAWCRNVTCVSNSRKDKTSVIFVEKPKSKEKIEMKDGIETTETKEPKYNVSDKSKEYWEIIRDAHEQGQAEYKGNNSQWDASVALNPKYTIHWINYDWRVKPKNRVITLEIPEDLEFSFDLDHNFDHYELNAYCEGTKEILQKIVDAFQKS